MGSKTFVGGVHPYEGKELAKDAPIKEVLPKGELVYPVSQHIGAPATPIVEKGDTVLKGQKIAEAGGFVSSPIYSSVSGTVKAIEKRRVAVGDMVNCIIIESDGEFKQVEYQTVEEEAVMEEKPENSQHQKEQPAHEDSNIQTDVAGKAEQIAHTGVPMHVAEKEAKAISDDEQHAAYHQVEKEAQQDVSPKVSEETAKDEQISTAKAATHASILLGALEMAKSHDGVWMNGKGKSNAEFLHFKKPITPFNNLMMNLNSDLQGYKTNVYTSFNPAKDNDMPVMRGQTSLPFNWTKWEYQNVTNPNDTISKEQYAELSDAEKTNYAIHATRLRFHMYNIDQTVMPANDVEGYGSLVREKGDQIKNFSKDHAKELSAETAVSYVMEQEKKHPDAIILIRNKDFYETYGEKADVMGKVLGLPASTKDVGGKKISYAAFPYHALDNCLPKLIRAGNRIAMNDG